uniref:uncharacterized protein LOC105352527 n=1 Tax=Fragaria vesca subsp. vesca TaxID=101020 RepID=UPI0005C7F877|nr:PREDICTED: uncharacterized protein LOC105352527 [Fragaria vesca subsp. vesca]
MPSFLRPHVTHQEKAKHLAEKSVPASKVAAVPDNNLHLFNQGYLTTECEPAYAGIPRLISAVADSCVNTQGVTASISFGSSSNMIDHCVRPNHGFSAMISKENTGAFFEPSIRNFISKENAQGRVQFLSQSEGDRISDHGPYYQSIRPPMDILGGSYPFPQWKQRPVTFTERLLDDKFYGLPLNSHGELIQYSSKGGFDQLGKLNIVAGASNSLPAHSQHCVERELPSDQLNLFPMQNFVRENCSSHFPDRLGISYSGSAQRPDVHQLDFESRSRHSLRPLSDLDLFSISSSRCRQFDPVQNENIGRLVPKETSCPMPLNMNQPTMRLMGKDVAIGNSSRQIHGFDDGKVWMDKEIIAEHCPSRNALLQNFHQNCYSPTTSAKLKETVSQSFGVCSEQASQSNLRTKAPEFRFPHPYQKWQSSLGFEHGSHTTSKSPSSSFLQFPQSPSPAMFNGEHNFRAPFISRTESLQSQLFGSQLPVLSTPQVTYEHGISRPGETGYKQHQPHFRKSAFDFPFLNPECQENVRPSWFQNSSSKAGLPPWLLHATLERNRPITAPQVSPNTASKHLHHIIPRKNICNAPYLHYSSEISHSQEVKRSPVPQNAVQPQGVQVIPEENPSSAMTDMSYRNRMDLKDRMKPKNIGIKDLYPCKRIKRSAVDSTNLPNIIDLEVQEKSSVVAGLSSNGDFNIDEMQSNFRALDLESSRKQVKDSECITQKDGFESLCTETSKMDDVGRSGPIKLSAGAKHIIKPTPNVDQDNCRPIHSTIPFVAVTNDYTGPEPQKRSTKIYKF